MEATNFAILTTIKNPMGEITSSLRFITSYQNEFDVIHKMFGITTISEIEKLESLNIGLSLKKENIAALTLVDIKEDDIKTLDQHTVKKIKDIIWSIKSELKRYPNYTFNWEVMHIMVD